MADVLRYVALGDSSGVGIGAGAEGGYPARLARRLEAAGVPTRLTNLAVSGATSADVERGQLPRALSAGADLVTLGIGANDAWRMVPLSAFQANVDRIGAALAGLGAPVIVADVIDLSLVPAAEMAKAYLRLDLAQIRQRIEAINGHLRAMAARHGFALADLFSLSRREIPTHPEYFCGDGLHPSAAGYERWAELLWPDVERLARAGRARRS